MSYTINNIDLTSYGFVPTQAPGCNIALEGAWNMPDRINKSFHDWGDEEGIEPYLEANEIYWSGRDISLHGLIQGSNSYDCQEKVLAFHQLLGNPSRLLTLSCNWATMKVQYINSEIQYLDDGAATVITRFREPIVPAPSSYHTSYIINDIKPEIPLREADGIDGVSFSDIGVKLLRIEDYLNQSDIKDMEFRSYQDEGFQLKPSKSLEVNVYLGIESVSYLAFKSVLNRLSSGLMASGKRYLTNGLEALASFFCLKGYQVTEINISDEGITTALVKIPVIIDRNIYPIWMDHAGFPIQDQLGNSIYHGLNEAPVWRDELGNRITDENNQIILT